MFGLLLLIYGGWLAVFWPGMLGEDSLAILLEVGDPATYRSGKPAFWYYFVRLFYQGHHLVEIPIAFMMALSAFILARILAWCWTQRLYGTTISLLVFVCMAPHLIFFVGMLYPDGIYSVAVAGLLFEVWLIAHLRKASFLSLLVLTLTLPIAAFARPNGIIFLVPVAILVFIADKTSRRWIAAILLAWCALAVAAASTHKSSNHGALYPLAIFETVNFLQARPMNLWTASPRVLPSTIEVLTKHHPIETYTSHYDPDYWDPLQFTPTGPRVMAFPRQDRKIITRDFFRYNLWNNMPKFMGSRVNVFLVSALAQGGAPNLSYAQHVLQRINTQTTYRQFQLNQAERALTSLHEISYHYRWLLWTPFFGIGLLAWALLKGFQLHNKALLLIAAPMLIQLGAIFIFSIAGEYRYLLPFFTLPLVLLPILAFGARPIATRFPPK